MKTKSRFIVLSIVLILAALACNLPGSSSNNGQLPDGLTENYSLPSNATLSGAFNYSSEQEAVIQNHGSPTRFLILFGEAARQETWIYDLTGYTVVFRDGVKVSEKSVDAVYKEGMYATTYSPNLFYEGMTVDEVVLATGKNDFMLTSVPELEHMRLMDMEGLTIGLVNDRVSYIETIPALTETQLTADDFFSLTPEEAANQGKHTYVGSFTVDGETYQDDYGELEFVFDGSGMQMGVEGYFLPFERIGQNQYYSETEGGITITITLEGFQMLYVSDGQQVILTRTDAAVQPPAGQDTPAAGLTSEELANQGKHTYAGSLIVDGETYEDDFGEVEFTFENGSMSMGFAGGVDQFERIGQNQYYSEIEGGVTITFTVNGFILEYGDYGDQSIQVRVDGSSSGQQPSTTSRTPEELANEGTHFYTSEVWIDGAAVVEDFGTIEFDFLEEEVLFTMDGETLLFNYFDENTYYSDVDGGISITFNLDGVVLFMHSDNTGVILNRQD